LTTVLAGVDLVDHPARGRIDVAEATFETIHRNLLS
jgi:hypothetical protein